ncbi:uncharacterized protein [Pseudorasbora parva]|uniref:uncharacterized protein isoform X2 n=1 Tax=Pseudorasbora parva TaxID=51549 RepID=UPI00351E1AF5
MMSDVKRQMSWHEDFAKNISRFFSRSKSVDAEGEESESRDADQDQTPEQHLNTEAPAQESQLCDGSSASQTEDRGSTAPADGFLRRLFQFSRREQRQIQADTHTHRSGTECVTAERDTHTHSSGTECVTAERETHTHSSGGREEPVEPSVCHSEPTHTQSQEQTEEDRSDGLNIDAKEYLEEKRRQDLACPPVVTYGTYRGLREVRKPKKKHHVELHSPISEGEEATQPDSHEDNEISSSSVNTMNSDCQDYPTSPSQTQQLEDALTQRDLLDEVPTVESGPTPAHQPSHVADSEQCLTCIEVYKIPQAAEPSPLNGLVNSRQKHLAQSVTLETLSGDTNDLTLSNPNTDHHNTLPIPEQSSEQPKPSVIVNWTDDPALDSQSHQCPEEPKGLDEVDSVLDDEVLRSESKKMVDSILTNALAALQKMEVSEFNEGSEAGLFEGLDRRRDGGTDAEHVFHGILSDQTLSAALGEDLAGHMDIRSPPSSGYESIAGSDTDIRCFLGMNSDLTTTSAPISSQNENQAILEYSTILEEKNVDVTGSRKSIGRNRSADDEPLSQNLHSHRDVVHKTDIKLFIPALSEESLSQEQHTGEVSAGGEKGGKRPQEAAKDNAMSNNCRALTHSSCDPSIISPASAVHQESLQHNLTLSVTLSDPFSLSLASNTADSDMMSEISQQPPAIPEETEAAYPGCSEQEQISNAGTESSVQPSVTEVHYHPSHWVSVQSAHDLSLSPLEEHLKPELTVNLADSGKSAGSVSSRRIHLDPVDSSSRTAAVVPHHSRFHDLDLHQVDGGFAIISEEEESDMVFVNDTGPMHSPSTRRARTYPFSLSPIYEEESGREEAERLQFPPGPEEEQRSVEQPASSILSLLQSVSERLQSSVICSSNEDLLSYSHRHHSEEEEEDSSNLLSYSHRHHSEEEEEDSSNLLSYSHRHHSEEEEEDSSNLLSCQLTGAKPEHELNSNNDGTVNDALDITEEEQDWDDTLGNIGENASTPFYQYLKTRLMPSGEEEPEDAKGIVCPSDCNAFVMEENRGFGKINPRPTPMLIYEGQSLSCERREICEDVEDAGKDLFAHRATFHALRGCWLLYVDAWYRGSCVVLEEGQTVKTTGIVYQNLEESGRTDPGRTDPGRTQPGRVHQNLEESGRTDPGRTDPGRTQPGRVHQNLEESGRTDPGRTDPGRTQPGRVHQNLEESGRTQPDAVLSVGSIRTLLKDDNVPEIHLYPSSPQTVRLYSGTDLTERLGPVFLSDLCVRTGCWLVFEQPGFSGTSAVLETGGRVTPVLQDSLLSCVKSLRPLKMGGLRVTKPLDPKIMLFEKPQFQGQCRELLDHTPHLRDVQGPVTSLRVTGGIWVGFSSEGFRGHQCVLEEGEYGDCTRLFSGTELSIQSLRYIQTDFLEPAVCLKSSDEEIHVHLDIPDLQEADSISVKNGAESLVCVCVYSVSL